MILIYDSRIVDKDKIGRALLTTSFFVAEYDGNEYRVVKDRVNGVHRVFTDKKELLDYISVEYFR